MFPEKDPQCISWIIQALKVFVSICEVCDIKKTRWELQVEDNKSPLEDDTVALRGVANRLGGVWTLLVLPELPNFICVKSPRWLHSATGRCTMPLLSLMHNISDQDKSLDLCTHPHTDTEALLFSARPLAKHLTKLWRVAKVPTRLKTCLERKYWIVGSKEIVGCWTKHFYSLV